MQDNEGYYNRQIKVKGGLTMYHLSDQGVIYYDLRTLTESTAKQASEVKSFVLGVEDIVKLYGPINTQKVKHNPSYYIKSRSRKVV